MQKKWPCNTTRIAKIILKIRQSLAGTFGGLFLHPIISQLVYKRWAQYDQRKRENFRKAFPFGNHQLYIRPSCGSWLSDPVVINCLSDPSAGAWLSDPIIINRLSDPPAGAWLSDPVIINRLSDPPAGAWLSDNYLVLFVRLF